MKEKTIIILSLVATTLVFFLLWGISNSQKGDAAYLRNQQVCDSLFQVTRNQEKRIDELYQEIENLNDQLDDCTEDFQNCVSGRWKFGETQARNY